MLLVGVGAGAALTVSWISHLTYIIGRVEHEYLNKGAWHLIRGVVDSGDF